MAATTTQLERVGVFWRGGGGGTQWGERRGMSVCDFMWKGHCPPTGGVIPMWPKSFNWPVLGTVEVISKSEDDSNFTIQMWADFRFQTLLYLYMAEWIIVVLFVIMSLDFVRMLWNNHTTVPVHHFQQKKTLEGGSYLVPPVTTPDLKTCKLADAHCWSHPY